MRYKTCPDCGAHLDPGERCDCKEESPQGGNLASSDKKMEKTLTTVYHGHGKEATHVLVQSMRKRV